MTNMRTLVVIGLLLALLSLAGCAAQANPYEKVPNEQEYTAGFWRGLWHGIITPITFIISLFSDMVNIYEVHNNGNWYNLGFAGALFQLRRRWGRRSTSPPLEKGSEG